MSWYEVGAKLVRSRYKVNARPGGSILGVLGHHFDASLLIQGSLGTPNRIPWSPDFDFCRFLIDSGFPWDPLGGHFADFGLPCLLYGPSDGFLVVREWKSCQDWMLRCA